VAALATTPGGLDRLVFTGGIGEHAAPVRGSICDGLGHLGVTVNPDRNAASDRYILTDGSDCEVLVIPTDEDSIIAQHCRHILAKSTPQNKLPG
jgi:acetate kinase